MTFTECCEKCITNKEFVNEFNRLTGNHIGERRSPIEQAIDNACGYDPDKDAMGDFCAFVHECVWIPLLSQAQKERAE